MFRYDNEQSDLIHRIKGEKILQDLPKYDLLKFDTHEAQRHESRKSTDFIVTKFFVLYEYTLLNDFLKIQIISIDIYN